LKNRHWALGARHRGGRWGTGVGVGVVISALALSGCRADMQDSPRYRPYRESAVAAGMSSAQPIVEGTVARDHLDDDELLYTGKAGGKPADMFPFPITAADLDRGQQRFNIYCSPCHGRTGEGNGMVVQRGFKQAASYHIDRLRQMPVEDRWRIVAYIRALQLSHHATTGDVPADELKKLTPGGAGAPAAAKPEGRSGGHE